MEKVKELSIFFPFWNEEKNIERVIKKTIPTVKRVAYKWEIIMVDDGSSDKTFEKALELSKLYTNLKAVRNAKNRGYGAALKTGFRASKYNLIAFLDGDGQFDFSEIVKFLDKIGEADIVIGFRKKRLDHPFRHLLMNLLKVWNFVFFGFYFRDIDCGFKLFRKSAIARISPFRSEGAMITTEILAKARKNKLNIKQVEVTHYPRLYGDQSGGNLRVILRAIKESFLLRKELG